MLPEDPHSFANPDEARVRHVDLRLAVDFERRTLAGAATLRLDRVPGARDLVLDTRGLEIRGVVTPGGDSLRWSLGEPVAHLGRPLRIGLPAGVELVEVHYRTAPDAAAVQWLDPVQTSSGAPFLFTQGQAILTRTWIPTQDSPGIRQTYSATITVPEGLTAVMSAEMLTPEGEPTNAGRVFAFELDRPVPPYLIALAVGDLAFRSVGPRTGVYAEPGVVEAAAYEFAEMEDMLEAAEALYGPYRWGRYDVLVLPPSFPFGGMENPRLTFATPTILAGDRSLVSLIAHELAHSWSGNLVTNATWSDFWLNEGFTVYFENRIMEAVYGPEYAAMLEFLGREGLKAEIEDQLGGYESPETILHLDLAGRDPDEGMTAIAYDKGAAFLRTIETVVGRERFDRFLRQYFDAHAFQPMTTDRFLAYLDEHLLAGNPEWREAIQPEEWAYQPGLPSTIAPVESRAFETVEGHVAAFVEGADPGELPTEGWSTHEWLHFLQSLPRELPEDRLRALDAAFGLTESRNSEVLFEWLRLAIANRYEPAFAALEDFLVRQGRRKFLRPLYQDLARTDWGEAMALRIYRRARPTYHAISRSSIDEVLDWPRDD
ncbi:MAG: aminopeptidase [Gemmatimonadetes bacterium]|nr:M1 family metallopeptidase [Gemmatimonadota bacterium]NIQ53687.1 M1 family metallopeptidase [Gemmatimonadota bacterium]NIU73857.1 aminopeptidase [Gammaproteobacteria bacterium]NIX42787.1 aminopeptidase [Gemmatimonadota bacterium]NIY08161.1 aminopeptidase [Gemmatimonadota bacterium]